MAHKQGQRTWSVDPHSGQPRDPVRILRLCYKDWRRWRTSKDNVPGRLTLIVSSPEIQRGVCACAIKIGGDGAQVRTTHLVG